MRTAAQTAMLMAIFTLASKCLGFLREMVMANYFGTSYITDSFVMATAIPGIIFGCIIGSVSVAFMPTYSKVFEHEGENKANQFTSGVINIILIASILFAVLGLLFAKQIVELFASGFHGETAKLTIFFLRITFISIIFSATADILEAFLRYKGVFIPQVAFGVIHNILMISTIIISALTSYYYLAFGYLLVFIIRLGIMSWISGKKSFKYFISKRIDKSILRVLALSLPVFIGSFMNQVNAFVDKTLASRLPVGSVSALYYGNLLINLIIGLTITIITTIIYPKLTQASAIGDSRRLGNICGTGISLILLIALPCTLGSLLFSNQVVQIVYERGSFDATATSMTATAFFYYVIGLTFVSLNTMINQVYFSLNNMKTPVIFGVVGVIINITLNLILIRYMAHGGLALATSIAAICITIMAILSFTKKYPNIKLFESSKKLIRIILAAVLSIGAAYIVYLFVILPLNHIIVTKFAQLLLVVIIAGILYLVLLVLLRIDEVKLLQQIITNKSGDS